MDWLLNINESYPNNLRFSFYHFNENGNLIWNLIYQKKKKKLKSQLGK
jgi:hypothetical protein